MLQNIVYNEDVEFIKYIIALRVAERVYKELIELIKIYFHYKDIM